MDEIIISGVLLYMYLYEIIGRCDHFLLRFCTSVATQTVDDNAAC